MNSSSRPGPMTRLRLGWPSWVRSSSVCAGLAMAQMLARRRGVRDPNARAHGANSPDTRGMGEPSATGPLTCLVTGATGYIGGRLVPELLDAGHRVRVLTRSPERVRDHPWAGRVEIARADAG